MVPAYRYKLLITFKESEYGNSQSFTESLTDVYVSNMFSVIWIYIFFEEILDLYII